MECWGYYCYYPWPVEVPVDAGGGTVWTWLGPVLLFGASLVASGVAYLGIRKSNATNQAAISAADHRAATDRMEMRDRDFRTWQRDTLLRLGSDVMEATYAILDNWRAIAHESDPDVVLSRSEAIETEGKRIAASFAALRLIGAHDAAEQCRAVRAAFANRGLQSAALEAHREVRRSRESDSPNDLTHETGAVLWRQRLEEMLDGTMEVLGEFADTIERELHALITLSQPKRE